MAQPTDFFTKEISQIYDERNRQLAPISECLYFLLRLMLKDLPKNSRVLCVGVGTGAEILSLAKDFPAFTFLGIDPSAPMLEVCRERLTAAGVIDRCELLHGYIHDAPEGENFNVALSILVGHFVPREEKVNYYRAISTRLRSGGTFIDAQISFDLNSPELPLMLDHWARLQAIRGADAEALAKLSQQLREPLSILPPDEVEGLLKLSGISSPLRFFQALMICGWLCTKN